MSQRYEVKGREDIIKIPDAKTGHTLARSWGLSLKGVKSKDDIIKVLLNDWDEKHARVKTDVNAIEDIMVESDTKKKMLLQKYEDMKLFYDQLHVVIREDVDSVFQNFTSELKSRMEQVMSQDCIILVSGDRVSGKSSFINLLLGKNILPTQQLACTATICELRYANDSGESHFAMLHSKDNSQRLDLMDGEKDGFKPLKENIQELIEDESPYERIEIFWPFDLLKHGVVIVDTPGISENRTIMQRLSEYMKQSFGFIYVIDSAQAAGFQKGRFTEFLRLVINSSDDLFDSRATMFVCNKWDVVPQADRTKIKSITMDKLGRVFPGLSNSQVFTFSTVEALRSSTFKSTNPEFITLFEKGFKRLVPAAMQNKLLDNYRWLKQVLQRVCYSLDMAEMVSTQQLQVNNDNLQRLKEQITILQHDAKNIIQSARDNVEAQINDVYTRIADFLRSRSARDKICTWDHDCCPRQTDFKRIYKDATERIANRIMETVNHWETEHGIVQGLHESIVLKLEEECKFMENQMQEIEGVLCTGGKTKHNDIRRLTSDVLLFSGNIPGDIDNIGSVVSCAGNLSWSDKKVRHLFKKYKLDINGQEIMMEASVYYVEAIFSSNMLRNSVSKFLRRFIKGIDIVAEKIPQFIKADNALIWNLELDVNETVGALKSVYPALTRRSHELIGQLDMFYVTYLMKQDYSLNSIKWRPEDLLGAGRFSNLYKATLNVGEDRIHVSVKLTNDHNSVNESTVTDILREEETLRNLKHQNIMKYYGSIVYEFEKTYLKWAMVLENCHDTIKNKLIIGSFKNPGCVRREQRMVQIQKMAEYVTQLCSGLQYLHDKNLVHRDLKSENILIITEDGRDVVKVSDVGLTRHKELTATFSGTPVHMAPEIMCRFKPYDRKADIYSLSILLWELWYGQEASEHITQVLQELKLTFTEAIEQHKLRPSLEIQHCPTLEIEDVITRCWDNSPQKRLDARDVEYFFQTYLNQD